jgi:hypothetical protein
MEEEREYLIILDLLCRVVEVNRGVELGDEKLREAEALARKLFFHSASAFYLSRGTTIMDFPSVEVDFVDPASVYVLARAIHESFLVFHYIFGSSISEEERDFRFYSWKLGGLKERQGFSKEIQKVPFMFPEVAKVLADDQKLIKNYEEILKNNRVFLNLEKKEQKKILEGNWRTLSWRQIAIDAKLSNIDAEHFYRYLCGYAHSSSLSTMQTYKAKTREQQLDLIPAARGVIKTTMSNFIFEYCNLFPNSSLELEKNVEAKKVAEDLLWIGQKNIE